MKIIGVYGGSGSGKSTTTNMLHEKINNSGIINMDDFMHINYNKHKTEILKALNVMEEPGVWWYNYLSVNFQTKKVAIEIIKDDMENDFRRAVMENSMCDTCIVDWAFLPLLDIMNNCDFTIAVSTEYETRYTRLRQRLIQEGKTDHWPKNAFINRLRNSTLDEFGYIPNYCIHNNGTFQDLSNGIDDILLREHIIVRNISNQEQDEMER